MTQETVSVPPQPTSRLKMILGSILLMLFGVVFMLLLLEILMRVGFDALPASVQANIQQVRRVPWSDEAIVPPVPFITDRRLQARLEPGLHNYPVRWHDARFTFDTGTVWEDHPIGLRTTGPVYPLDILAFGDSFTFCWTAVDDCWVQLLGSDYGWSATNAGIPGTGSTGQLHFIQEIAPPMQPKLIIWQWYGNDLFDDYVLSWLNDETPPLEGAPGPDAATSPQGIAQFSAIARMVEVALNPPQSTSPYQHNQVIPVNRRQMLLPTNEYTHSFNPTYPAVAYGWERNLEAHETGEALADEIGAEMLIVLIPPKEEAYAEFLVEQYDQEYIDAIGESRRMLLNTCEERGWHCLDALPAFQEAIRDDETIYYALDFHLNDSGNRLLAQLIQDYITQNGLLTEGSD